MKVPMLMTTDTTAHHAPGDCSTPRFFCMPLAEVSPGRNRIGQVCECTKFTRQRPYNDNGLDTLGTQAGQILSARFASPVSAASTSLKTSNRLLFATALPTSSAVTFPSPRISRSFSISCPAASKFPSTRSAISATAPRSGCRPACAYAPRSSPVARADRSAKSGHLRRQTRSS